MATDSGAMPFGLSRGTWVYAKLGVLGLMIGLFLVVLAFVQNLVAERQTRQGAVTKEIGEIWGHAQSMTGPILIIPYTYQATERSTADDRRVTRTGWHFVLPETLLVTAKVDPEIRYRGIFKAAVYRADMKYSGQFRMPAPDALGMGQVEFQWDKAVLAVGADDLRGVPKAPIVTWAGRKIEFAPGTTREILLPNGLHAPIGTAHAPGATVEFSFEIGLAGTSPLAFAPTAKSTEVQVKSSWRHPTFGGAYLPVARSIDETGFAATWRIANLALAFPQQWTETGASGFSTEDAKIARAFKHSSFNIALASPVSFYQQVERSLKYGVMFIVIVITAIFVFDVLGGLKVHLLQYMLVGAALCLFFLLLLSFAEAIGFALAYAAAATMSTLLIAWYIGAAIGARRRGWVIGGILGATYATLYVILQLEAWAMIGGSLALFTTLATLMYVTRNIDWASFDRSPPASGEPVEGKPA